MKHTNKPLFSVTREDCDWQTFASGGPGGQHQNKTESGVRVVHRPSGAVGESREYRSQHVNRRTAFSRMAQSPVFMAWARLHSSHLIGKKSVDELVDASLEPQNLKVEVRDENGKWRAE